MRGLFDLQPLDPIRVKGISEPLQTYWVLRERAHSFRMDQRGLEGVHTPTIGRETELEQLQEALHQVIKRRELRLVAVIGEAGVGKSRLIYEFDRWLDRIPEPVRYFKARAGPAMTGQPYTLLRDLFSFRFEIHDSDPPNLLREKLETGVRAAMGDRPDWERRAHYLGRLFGFEFGPSPHLLAGQPDARGFHDQAVLYLDEYFQELAMQNPLAILLEDLHWADDSSLDLLDHLETALAGHPILVVCAARPSLFERRPDWRVRVDTLTRIDLAPSRRATAAGWSMRSSQTCARSPSRSKTWSSLAPKATPSTSKSSSRCSSSSVSSRHSPAPGESTYLTFPALKSHPLWSACSRPAWIVYPPRNAWSCSAPP